MPRPSGRKPLPAEPAAAGRGAGRPLPAGIRRPSDSHDAERGDSDSAHPVDAGRFGRRARDWKSRAVGPNARRFQTLLLRSYLIGAAISFVALSLIARRKPYFDLDLRMLRALQRLEHPWYARVMHAVSWPGYPPQANVLAALLSVAMYRGGLKWEAVATTLSAFGMSVAGLSVKLLVNRPRPHPDMVRVRRLLDGGRQSFPAGHVQIYVPLFGFLAFISYTVIQRSWQRTLALWASLTAIALVGLSRVHTGEHWPSDVLGGYFFGSIWLWLTVKLYRRGKPATEPKP